jgi:type 1 fimbria pilin
MKLFNTVFVLFGALFSASTSYAVCSLNWNPLTADTTDGNATAIQLGNVNIASAYVQPVGTVLAHTVVPSPILPNAKSPEQAIWICDKADLPNIYFLVATNGDERWNGYNDIGGPDGLTDVYATLWKYVGLKLQMRDVVLTRYWKKLDIETYGTRSDGKIEIRVKDIPPLEATLYRVSSVPTTGKVVCYGPILYGTYKVGYNKPLYGQNPLYCNQPSGYVQLSGNGKSAITFGHDPVGSDSDIYFAFFGAYNGFAYGFLNSSTRLSVVDSCAARNATPIVNFGTMQSADLKNGMIATAKVNVEIECSDTATSGTATDQVAIGFLPSASALNNAKTLGLLSSNGTSEYLVSDNYNDDSSAKGVGIQISNSRTGTKMRFLDEIHLAGTGTASGWYPVLEGNPGKISSISGYSTYLQQYDATLKKLPNEEVKAGKIKSTATVIVKVQ